MANLGCFLNPLLPSRAGEEETFCLIYPYGR
nr:MAG TPA: hypothetical protein [Caudoviricetes sp.]